MFKPYSQSKISAFESCPMKFKFQYIDKIKPECKFDHLERGRSVHKDLELYPNCNNETVLKFMQSEVGQKYSKLLLGDIKREVRIGLNEGYELSCYDKANVLNGIIDLIFIKDGVVHIVDWKTGRVPEEQNWDQLETYAIAFLKKYDVSVSYVYVDHCVERTKLITQDQRESLVNKLKSRINLIESCTEFNRSVSWLCEYCPFKDLCKPEEFGIEATTISI